MGCKFCLIVPALTIAQGDVIVYNSSGVPIMLNVGADETIVKADSSTASGLKYSSYAPKRCHVFHHMSQVETGNAILKTATGVQWHCYVANQNPPADGNVFTSNVYLQKDTNYTFYAHGTTGSNRGIIDWTLDGASIVSGEDWYGGAAYNAVKSTGGVTVSTSGEHELKGTINGKNVLSGGYYMYLTTMWFEPSDD